jgi:hypothetical protein
MTARTFMEYKRKTRRGQVKLTLRQAAKLMLLVALVFLSVMYALYLALRPAFAR